MFLNAMYSKDQYRDSLSGNARAYEEIRKQAGTWLVADNACEKLVLSQREC